MQGAHWWNEQAYDSHLTLYFSIAELEGTKAPDKVTLATLAEISDAFMQIVAQALPDQQNLSMQVMLQKLRGTQQGALLTGTLAANARFYIDAEDNEADLEADDGELEATGEQSPFP